MHAHGYFFRHSVFLVVGFSLLSLQACPKESSPCRCPDAATAPCHAEASTGEKTTRDGAKSEVRTNEASADASVNERIREPVKEDTQGGSTPEPPTVVATQRCVSPSASFYRAPSALPAGTSVGLPLRCEQLGAHSTQSLGLDPRFQASGGTPSHGMQMLRLRYSTRDMGGKAVRATALLYIPQTAQGQCQTKAPVVLLAHGTMGMAATCGPSRFPDAGLHALALPLVGRGMLVLAPDYLGLGQAHPQGHPYLQPQPTIQAMVDALGALRALGRTNALTGCVGQSLLLLGHSQGGHATLVATPRISQLQSYRLTGSVAMAPAFGDQRLWLGPFQANFRSTTATAYFLMYLHAVARSRGIAPTQWLTPKAAALLPGLLDSFCFNEWNALLRNQFPTFRDIFAPSFLSASIACRGGQGDCSKWQPWREAIAQTEIDTSQIKTPVLLVQGSSDAVVSAASVGCIAKRMSQQNKKASICQLTGANHLTMIGRSWKGILPWIQQALQGQPPTALNCENRPLPPCP